MKKLKSFVNTCLIFASISGAVFISGCGNSATNSPNGQPQEINIDLNKTESDTLMSISDAEKLYRKAADLEFYDFGCTNASPAKLVNPAHPENGEQDYRETQNYDSSLDAVYSKQGKEYYEAAHSDKFVRKDGKVYRLDADKGSNLLYRGTSLKLVKNSGNRLYYEAKSKYIPENMHFDDPENYKGDFNYESNIFVLANENGKWLVELFMPPC